MKRIYAIFILLLCSVATLSAQKPKNVVLPSQFVDNHGVTHYGFDIDKRTGDTIIVVTLGPVYCFKNPADWRRYQKLIRDFKVAYPISLIARTKMHNLEDSLMHISSRRLQRAYIRQIEREVKDEYTPILGRMTRSQGKILIRLIDRETNCSTYDIVRQFRGAFVAGFWQGVAKIFGHDLKDEYDKENRDKVLEQLIYLYEAGLI